MPNETILVIDNNLEMRESLKRILAMDGYPIRCAADGDSGLQLAIQLQPDLILLDMSLPDLNGLQLLEALHQSECRAPVIFMTAFGSERMVVEALRLGVRDYLNKPFSAEEVRRAVEAAQRERRLAAQREALNRELVAAEAVRVTVVTLSHYLNNYLMSLEANLELIEEGLPNNAGAGLSEAVKCGKFSARCIEAVLKVLHKTTKVSLAPYAGSTPIIDIEAALRRELDKLPGDSFLPGE